MSQSPSYQRDSASKSPERHKEGDFSPQQLYDNLKGPEEHKTTDDQKDPIGNILPDNYSISLLYTQIFVSLATNDLEKRCADTFPQEQLIKKSELVELDMKQYENCSQLGCLYILDIYIRIYIQLFFLFHPGHWTEPRCSSTSSRKKKKL